MVFGEPDIEVRPVGEGRLKAEIRGLDVHDPTTGVLRSTGRVRIGKPRAQQRSRETRGRRAII